MNGQTEERIRSMAADLDRAAPAVGVAEAMHAHNSKPGRLPRRTGQLALVAAAAIVVAMAVSGALMRSDSAKLRTGPAPASEPLDHPATPETPTTTEPTPAAPPPGPVTLDIPIAVAALPEVGVGMIHGDYVVLLDGTGAEFGRARTGDFFIAKPGELLGVTVANGTARVVSEPTAPRPAGSPFADDCVDAHKVAGTVIARCGSPGAPQRIDVAIGPGAARTVVGSPPSRPGQTPIGHWRAARVSPDGSRVLAQWSAECEVPTAFFIDTSTGELRTVTGERGPDWTEAPSSGAGGWLRDGRAVVTVSTGACGPAAEAPGVYISTEPGSSDLRMLFRSADGAPVAFVWERSDDHRWDGPLRHRPEGTMDTEAFNRFLADRRPPWAARAETAAAVALGPAPEGEGAARSVDTAQEAGRPGRVVVTVIDDGLPDDSIRSQRYRLTFVTEPGQPLRLEGALVDWRCREGRGHEQFSTEPCV